MARRKPVTATPEERSPAEDTAAQSATATAVLDAPDAEAPARQWRANPWPVKTANLGGYKIVLQESRPEKQAREPGDDAVRNEPWSMQIKFGDGSKDDMPSGAVLDYIKSHTKTVTTKEGEEFEVSLLRWNHSDQAWAMPIDFDAPRTSRLKAEQVFADVVDMIAAERGIERER